jgi:hypothetical protein
MQESKITVNGTQLSDSEVRVVGVALEALANILENDLDLKDDGIPLTDRYQSDIAHVLALLENRKSRAQ